MSTNEKYAKKVMKKSVRSVEKSLKARLGDVTPLHSLQLAIETGRFLGVMLTVSQEFLVDGKPPMEEKEPSLHLGAQDRLVQPLVPPAPARLLGQPVEAQAWCQAAYFLNRVSAAATASLIKCPCLLTLTRNVTLNGN